ncbi:MAG: 4Fe-4S binding protein, partial [Atopobiaceae bacterium]|nr:4Fe-4S binding protein [Atopobiaceae bacterium]
MGARLTEDEIAARNVLPDGVTNPHNGEPLRVIAPEHFTENDAVVHYKPADPNEPGPASHEPLKPGVLKTAQKVTNRLLVKIGQDDPDYWGLASVMTEEEAELCAHMKRRVPEFFEEVVAGTGWDEERVQSVLDDLCRKGIIEYNWENLDGRNPDHRKRYVLPLFVPGSAEFTVMNQRQVEEHPEIATFFERSAFLPLKLATPLVPMGGAGIGMHVIPVEHAIRQESVTADVEHLSHWLKKYDTYAAGSCSCGIAERARGDNDGRDPQNWCIGVGDMATYLVETGKGHYITYDEVIDTLILAERNGYVHQITNIDGEDKIFAICNCDANICYALRTSQLFNTPNLSRSAYVAHVDEERCVACAGCVEVCPAGAVQLGQKLACASGPIEYPRQPLPDARSWDEAQWDPDYRDNNRIETHETGTAPCKTACPAHVSVQGYLRMAAQGRYRDALALIKRENPFPAVCGRVCNRRCEVACTRGTVDEAVAIDEVKRFIAEKDLEAATRY